MPHSIRYVLQESQALAVPSCSVHLQSQHQAECLVLEHQAHKGVRCFLSNSYSTDDHCQDTRTLE